MRATKNVRPMLYLKEEKKVIWNFMLDSRPMDETMTLD